MSEAETHYGIDLELLDDNEEVVAQGIPAASPLQSHVQLKIANETATTKTKKKNHRESNRTPFYHAYSNHICSDTRHGYMRY